ncbi:hypothetical protein GCM10027034_08020 [Ramlibacter solisilvae]|uniref:hypothetical protein n=1 Tax=Ramlibacter tataouinensis TaxID=94132 RepID=UPI0009ED5E7B|nr:hypothetical protein [Ramlibacter tataouinensis]
MYLLIIGWLYVALMMAVVEATSAVGSVVGAFFTFLLYGVAPVALLWYLLVGRSGRPRNGIQAPGTMTQQGPSPDSAVDADRGGQAPADPVAPVRKEP